MDILNRLRETSRSEFVRHVATYAAGVSFAQILPILLTPLFSRIYGPEAYGVYGAFSAVVAIIAVAGGGSFEQAILLPANIRESVAVLGLTAVTIVGSCGVLLIVALLAHAFCHYCLVAQGYWAPLVLLMPIYAWLTATSTAVVGWLTRTKQFSAISRSLIMQAVINCGLTLLLGIIPGFTYFGLIFAQIAAQAGSLITLAWAAMPTLRDTGLPTRREIIDQAFRYHRFPFFALPALIIGTISAQLPILAATSLFGVGAAGQLTMTLRILFLPTRFLGQAMRDVFRQRASVDARTTTGSRPIFIKTGITLGTMSLAGAIPILLAGPQLFALVLGERWFGAGELARILVPMVIVSFVASPLSWMLYLHERQHWDFIWQIGFLCACVTSVITGYIVGSMTAMVAAWSTTGTAMYIAYLVLNYRLSGLRINHIPMG